MKKKNGNVNWNAFSENVEKVLGEDFWNDMHHVIPKRGPAYDYFETENEGVLVIELPGFTTDDHLHLTQQGTHLIMKGECKHRYPVAPEDLIHNERLKGKFNRTIAIPFHFNYEDITTSYKDGLLIVKIAKHSKEEEIVIRFQN